MAAAGLGFLLSVCMAAHAGTGFSSALEPSSVPASVPAPVSSSVPASVSASVSSSVPASVPATVSSTVSVSPASSVPAPVLQDPRAEAAALSLKALTLFSGTGKGFELYRPATRVEGAAMLVRLLGRSAEAASSKPGHPFRDVPVWAANTVGLMWNSGMTRGVSADLFGASDLLTGRMYCTFVLRALERVDDGTNAYAEAIRLSVSLGILSADSPVVADPDAPVLRAELVRMSVNALTVRMGKGTRTLLDTLVLRRQVPAEPAGRWLAARLAPVILGDATGEFERTQALHDWLVNRNRYGWLPKSDDPEGILSAEAYTALSLGTGVCGAYSRAMQFLCGEAGIACELVIGQADGTAGWTGHAWNQVNIDGDWYQMDVTFDDPVGTDVLRYNYFNLTDEEFARDHAWDRTAWPACTATAANWFVRKGLVVSSFPQFEQSVLSVVGKRGTELTVRVNPFSKRVYNEAAIRGILVDTGVVSGYSHSLDPVTGVIRLMNLKYFASAPQVPG